MATVDAANRDFSDVKSPWDVIGDSRVVLVRKESHGDGTVFLARTRLIEFLHQEMGFDVLAAESGLLDMRKAWEAMVRGDDPRRAWAEAPSSSASAPSRHATTPRATSAPTKPKAGTPGAGHV